MSTRRINGSWWSEWLRSSYRYVDFDSKGINFSGGKKGRSAAATWSEIQAPPSLLRFWIFRTISLQTRSGTVRLHFRDIDQAKAAWQEISQAWYAPRIEMISSSLSRVSQFLEKPRYTRTSQWTPLEQSLEQWTSKLPPLPPAGVLPPEQHQILALARELTAAPKVRLETARASYIETALEQYATLFETVESMPLTANQRRACVVDEDNNLVLAGAGTGKTSTIMGRVAFLVNSGQARPDEILLLAYGNKAAAEMRDRLENRIGIKGVMASTFHAVGQLILSQVEGRKPSITPMAEDLAAKAYFVNSELQRLENDEAYCALLLRYFARWMYPDKNPFEFESQGDYYRFLEDNDVRTLKGEKVKSFAECLIANFLFRMGVNYQYEATYPTQQRSPDFRAYEPDFYLPDHGTYIEHFGVDRNGNTAPYIDRTQYQAGMAWKRAIHKEQQTRLIETFHYEQQEGQLLECLESRLKDADVTFDPLPPEALLETIREFGAVSAFAKLLGDLMELQKRSMLSPQELEAQIAGASHAEQMRAALALLKPVADRYEQELKRNNHIDFDDMIIKAIQYVEAGRFKAPWRYILVDEFQDISRPRARLVQALRKQQPDGSLFCVGDDWQSIYRFTGSDIELTTQFRHIFGPTQTTALDKSFRFNSSINAVASRFVMANPQQLRKTIEAHTKVDSRTVSLMRNRLQAKEALPEVLDHIAQIATSGSSVFLLARFKHDLPDTHQLRQLRRRYPNLSLNTASIHAAKGKEADYVVVLSLTKGEFGLPSEKTAHPLIELLLPKAEKHPHAEERRLFYVALTRARHRVYLVTDMSRASPFVRELLDGEYELDLEAFPCPPDQLHAQVMDCPLCKEGNLVLRINASSGMAFMGCSNYPRCDHTERMCPKCSSPMFRQGRFRVCVNKRCSWPIPICPVSGGDMSLKPGNGRQFWGCSHYRGNDPTSCDHTENYIELPKRPQKPRG
ncbi:ATP-dependent DNA helicase Rep [compost metagenome]